VGAGLFTAKFSGLEAPPPGEGFSTVTEAVPAVAMSPAGTEAVTCVLLTYVVVSPVPFHCTVDPETKFVPVTVRVNAAPPAVADVGESEVALGSGLLMVKVRALDVPPPGEGFSTVTEAVPAVAMSLAGTEAVTCVLLTYVVVSPVPFHCTVDPETKFVPVRVKVCAAAPATAEAGDRLVSVGAGLMPVPVRVTDCGLPLALSVMLTEAVSAPMTEGVKVTLIVQLAPAATELPHVLV
jgi:hypothetical protein